MTAQERTDDGRGTGQAGTAPVVASAADHPAPRDTAAAAMARAGAAGGPPSDVPSDAPAGAPALAPAQAPELPGGLPGGVPAGLPAAPPAADAVFGDRRALAERFAAILADTGVSHGLIGPREVPILWDRHILNCAVAHEAFPEGAAVVDVGSGAGLPGLALAIVRPDLQLHLVEPMLRRTTWLSTTIEELGLENCTVHRGRAEEFHGVLATAFATARAVARIDKLARWTFPLLLDGGTLVALKGGSAAEELNAEEKTLRSLGMTSARIETYGADVLPVPTTTLQLTIGTRPARTVSKAAARRAARGKAKPTGQGEGKGGGKGTSKGTSKGSPPRG